MKRLSLVLALLVTPLGNSVTFAEEAKPVQHVIGIRTPTGWILDIHGDGSGKLSIGSDAGDEWSFKAGTFDIEKVTKDLKALKSDDKGDGSSHFVYYLPAAEGKAQSTSPTGYSRDTKLISPILERAVEAANVKGAKRPGDLFGRGARFLEMYPPGRLKDQ